MRLTGEGDCLSAKGIDLERFVGVFGAVVNSGQRGAMNHDLGLGGFEGLVDTLTAGNVEGVEIDPQYGVIPVL